MNVTRSLALSHVVRIPAYAQPARVCCRAEICCTLMQTHVLSVKDMFKAAVI